MMISHYGRGPQGARPRAGQPVFVFKDFSADMLVEQSRRQQVHQEQDKDGFGGKVELSLDPVRGGYVERIEYSFNELQHIQQRYLALVGDLQEALMQVWQRGSRGSLQARINKSHILYQTSRSPRLRFKDLALLREELALIHRKFGCKLFRTIQDDGTPLLTNADFHQGLWCLLLSYLTGLKLGTLLELVDIFLFFRSSEGRVMELLVPGNADDATKQDLSDETGAGLFRLVEFLTPANFDSSMNTRHPTKRRRTNRGAVSFGASARSLHPDALPVSLLMLWVHLVDRERAVATSQRIVGLQELEQQLQKLRAKDGLHFFFEDALRLYLFERKILYPEQLPVSLEEIVNNHVLYKNMVALNVLTKASGLPLPIVYTRVVELVFLRNYIFGATDIAKKLLRHKFQFYNVRDYNPPLPLAQTIPANSRKRASFEGGDFNDNGVCFFVAGELKDKLFDSAYLLYIYLDVHLFCDPHEVKESILMAKSIEENPQFTQDQRVEVFRLIFDSYLRHNQLYDLDLRYFESNPLYQLQKLSSFSGVELFCRLYWDLGQILGYGRGMSADEARFMHAATLEAICYIYDAKFIKPEAFRRFHALTGRNKDQFDKLCELMYKHKHCPGPCSAPRSDKSFPLVLHGGREERLVVDFLPLFQKVDLLSEEEEPLPAPAPANLVEPAPFDFARTKIAANNHCTTMDQPGGMKPAVAYEVPDENYQVDAEEHEVNQDEGDQKQKVIAVDEDKDRSREENHENSEVDEENRASQLEDLEGHEIPLPQDQEENQVYCEDEEDYRHDTEEQDNVCGEQELGRAVAHLSVNGDEEDSRDDYGQFNYQPRQPNAQLGDAAEDDDNLAFDGSYAEGDAQFDGSDAEGEAHDEVDEENLEGQGYENEVVSHPAGRQYYGEEGTQDAENDADFAEQAEDDSEEPGSGQEKVEGLDSSPERSIRFQRIDGDSEMEAETPRVSRDGAEIANREPAEDVVVQAGSLSMNIGGARSDSTPAATEVLGNTSPFDSVKNAQNLDDGTSCQGYLKGQDPDTLAGYAGIPKIQSKAHDEVDDKGYEAYRLSIEGHDSASFGGSQEETAGRRLGNVQFSSARARTNLMTRQEDQPHPEQDAGDIADHEYDATEESQENSEDDRDRPNKTPMSVDTERSSRGEEHVAVNKEAVICEQTNQKEHSDGYLATAEESQGHSEEEEERPEQAAKIKKRGVGGEGTTRSADVRAGVMVPSQKGKEELVADGYEASGEEKENDGEVRSSIKENREAGYLATAEEESQAQTEDVDEEEEAVYLEQHKPQVGLEPTGFQPEPKEKGQRHVGFVADDPGYMADAQGHTDDEKPIKRSRSDGYQGGDSSIGQSDDEGPPSDTESPTRQLLEDDQKRQSRPILQSPSETPQSHQPGIAQDVQSLSGMSAADEGTTGRQDGDESSELDEDVDTKAQDVRVEPLVSTGSSLQAYAFAAQEQQQPKPAKTTSSHKVRARKATAISDFGPPKSSQTARITSEKPDQDSKLTTVPEDKAASSDGHLQEGREKLITEDVKMDVLLEEEEGPSTTNKLNNESKEQKESVGYTAVDMRGASANFENDVGAEMEMDVTEFQEGPGATRNLDREAEDLKELKNVVNTADDMRGASAKFEVEVGAEMDVLLEEQEVPIMNLNEKTEELKEPKNLGDTAQDVRGPSAKFKNEGSDKADSAGHNPSESLDETKPAPAIDAEMGEAAAQERIPPTDKEKPGLASVAETSEPAAWQHSELKDEGKLVSTRVDVMGEPVAHEHPEPKDEGNLDSAMDVVMGEPKPVTTINIETVIAPVPDPKNDNKFLAVSDVAKGGPADPESINDDKPVTPTYTDIREPAAPEPINNNKPITRDAGKLETTSSRSLDEGREKLGLEVSADKRELSSVKIPNDDMRDVDMGSPASVEPLAEVAGEPGKAADVRVGTFANEPGPPGVLGSDQIFHQHSNSLSARKATPEMLETIPENEEIDQRKQENSAQHEPPQFTPALQGRRRQSRTAASEELAAKKSGNSRKTQSSSDSHDDSLSQRKTRRDRRAVVEEMKDHDLFAGFGSTNRPKTSNADAAKRGDEESVVSPDKKQATKVRKRTADEDEYSAASTRNQRRTRSNTKQDGRADGTDEEQSVTSTQSQRRTRSNMKQDGRGGGTDEEQSATSTQSQRQTQSKKKEDGGGGGTDEEQSATSTQSQRRAQSSRKEDGRGGGQDEELSVTRTRSRTKQDGGGGSQDEEQSATSTHGRRRTRSRTKHDGREGGREEEQSLTSTHSQRRTRSSAKQDGGGGREEEQSVTSTHSQRRTRSNTKQDGVGSGRDNGHSVTSTNSQRRTRSSTKQGGGRDDQDEEQSKEPFRRTRSSVKQDGGGGGNDEEQSVTPAQCESRARSSFRQNEGNSGNDGQSVAWTHKSRNRGIEDTEVVAPTGSKRTTRAHAEESGGGDDGDGENVSQASTGNKIITRSIGKRTRGSDNDDLSTTTAESKEAEKRPRSRLVIPNKMLSLSSKTRSRK